TGRTLRFEFRCDSPSCTRLLEMGVSLVEPGVVEFRTRLLREEPRPPAALLAPDFPRSTELLRVCSWCKRIDARGEGAEVEEAVARLRLFAPPRLPQLTHGICEGCYARMQRMLAP